MNSIQQHIVPDLWASACLLALGLGSLPAAAQSTHVAAVPPAAAVPSSNPPLVPSTAAPAPATPLPRAAQATNASATGVPSASALNPARAEFPSAAPASSSAELDTLMTRVAALRSRIAALTTALFSSKLRVELQLVGDGARLQSLRVSLDGGLIYTAPAQAFFERPEVVYEHAVAPGPHVLGIEVERHELRAPQFSTWQSSRFVVIVPEKRLLWTRLELTDASSMGEDFAEDEAGEYELSVKLQAEVSE